MRLDHDRRAWVEAEAGRRGVTVRVLFEEFIDRARTGVDTTAVASYPTQGSVTDGEPLTATATPESDEAPTDDSRLLSAASAPQSRPWPCSEVARVSGLPGAAIRVVLSLTSALARAGGACVLRRSPGAGAQSAAPSRPSRQGP